MKQLISFVFSIILSVVAIAQKDKTTTKTTGVKPATPVLKTLNDSASYAVGISVANFYKQQGINKLNTTLVAKAINDVLGSKTTLLDDKAVNQVLNAYMNKMQEEKIKPVLEAGKQFLATNKKRPEIKTTASGLQYEVLIEGTGPKPKATDKVTVQYKGTFLNGMEFDSSFKTGKPATFALNGVIAGWTEGLQLMSVGSKYKFYVPHNLGYGMYDYNSIPGGSTLIFEIELLNVINNPAQ
jgi:FKBP-type peptidyl-prolyl cis-trans isomerase FklB